MKVALCIVLLLGPFTTSFAEAQEDGLHEESPPPLLFQEEAMPWWPWIASAGLLGATLAIGLSVDTSTPRWQSTGALDDVFLSWTASSVDGRRRAAIASDVFLVAAFAMPFVDAVAWPTPPERSRSRTTYRLLAMDTLAFSFESLVVVATKFFTRRARPYETSCAVDGNHDPVCGSSSRNQSFISGHTAAAFTGASLVCTHQRLRGRSLHGHFACASALAMASFVGAFRIVSERHYISDVVVGAAVGFVSGYLLPALFWRRHQATFESNVAPAAW